MKERLDPRSPVPLYYQLKEIFRSWITSGNFDSNQRFPSESELQERFRVSRMTIRRALSELVSEGFLVREQGRGSFVVKPWLKEQLGPLTSFTEEMRKSGIPCSSQILEFSLVFDGEIAQKMSISLNEHLVRLQRVRIAYNEPIALQTNFIRYKFCPDLIERGLLEDSLYKTLEVAYGLKLCWAKQVLFAKPADEYEARVLQIKAGHPLLAFERLTYLETGEPIEYVRSVYRGDKYRFVMTLKRIKEDNSTIERG
ncbi:MAG: GntR family transcriptional regulator [Clostridia bacterium]|nr:GntR family transcriptional regulator [Clostridia bacterium]